MLNRKQLALLLAFFALMSASIVYLPSASSVALCFVALMGILLLYIWKRMMRAKIKERLYEILARSSARTLDDDELWPLFHVVTLPQHFEMKEAQVWRVGDMKIGYLLYTSRAPAQDFSTSIFKLICLIPGSKRPFWYESAFSPFENSLRFQDKAARHLRLQKGILMRPHILLKKSDLDATLKELLTTTKPSRVYSLGSEIVLELEGEFYREKAALDFIQTLIRKASPVNAH